MAQFSIGDSGPVVRRLKRALIRRGYILADDDDYNRKTRDAVKAFQMSVGRPDTGVADPLTQKMILSVGRQEGGRGRGRGRSESEREVPEDSEMTEPTEPMTYGSPPFSGSTEGIEGDAGQALALAVQQSRDPRALAVVRAALRDVGKVERPLGSNEGEAIEHLVDGYWEFQGLDPDTSSPPWCAIAVSSWIRIGLGLDSWSDHPFGTWYGGVYQLRQWGERKGCFHDVGSLAAMEPGDVTIMDRSGGGARAGHTGIVVCDLDDEALVIEGNLGDGVRLKRRRKSELYGVVRWWS